jgi:hypothetical protein
MLKGLRTDNPSCMGGEGGGRESMTGKTEEISMTNSGD